MQAGPVQVSGLSLRREDYHTHGRGWESWQRKGVRSTQLGKPCSSATQKKEGWEVRPREGSHLAQARLWDNYLMSSRSRCVALVWGNIIHRKGAGPCCRNVTLSHSEAPFSFFFFNFFFNVYLFLGQRETEHEQGRGRERGRHRIGNRLQALSHQPRA